MMIASTENAARGLVRRPKADEDGYAGHQAVRVPVHHTPPSQWGTRDVPRIRLIVSWETPYSPARLRRLSLRDLSTTSPDLAT